MNDVLDLKEKISIIKHANLADATILENNYNHLIKDTTDYTERQQFVILYTNTKTRIKELTNNA